MNYLAHAFFVLENPAVVAGTSLPDWLRVIDRRARVKPAHLQTLDLSADHFADDLRRGVQKHYDDDHRFHLSPTFESLTDEAVHAIRALSTDPRLRATTLGHIAVEMLLDAALAKRDPTAIDRYYAAIKSVDVAAITSHARAWTGAALEHFPKLLDRFIRARFLESYSTDQGVIDSLEGVCIRARLPAPPDGTDQVIAALRPRIEAAADDLI